MLLSVLFFDFANAIGRAENGCGYKPTEKLAFGLIDAHCHYGKRHISFESYFCSKFHTTGSNIAFYWGIFYHFFVGAHILRPQLHSTACAHAPESIPIEYETDCIYAALNTVNYVIEQKLASHMPYSSISHIQKTAILDIYGPAGDFQLDRNEMREMCMNVIKVLIHLIQIGQIIVVGDIPSECFRLLVPMESVKVIVLDKYGGCGVPFEQFPLTEYVLIKGREPFMRIATLWTLSQVNTLIFDTIPPVHIAEQYTVDDTVLSNYIKNKATRLTGIHVNDCGIKSYVAILEAAKRSDFVYAKFRYVGIKVHMAYKPMNGAKGKAAKHLTLTISRSLYMLHFNFNLLPRDFEKITVTGSLCLTNPLDRYTVAWAHNNDETARYATLWEYIFTKSPNVTEIDLKSLMINWNTMDSFWFVHYFIKSIQAAPKGLLKLHVTHNTWGCRNIYTAYSSDVDNLSDDSVEKQAKREVKQILGKARGFKMVIYNKHVG